MRSDALAEPGVILPQPPDHPAAKALWSVLPARIGDTDCEDDESLHGRVLELLRALEPTALRSLHAALYEALEGLPHGYQLTRTHLDATPHEKPCDVLDIGSGTGAIVLPAARVNDRVVAVEPSEEMASRLRARLVREGLADRVTCWQHRFEEAPLEAGAFDVVHMRLVAHMIPPPAMDEWIARIGELLRDDGRLVLSALFEGGARRAGLKSRSRAWLASRGELTAFGWMLETMQMIQRELLIEPNSYAHEPEALARVMSKGGLRVESESADHFDGKAFLLTASARRLASRGRSRWRRLADEPRLARFSDLVAYLSEDVDWSPASDSSVRLRLVQAGLRAMALRPGALRQRCEEIASTPALLEHYLSQMEYPKDHFEVFVLYKDPEARFKIRMHRFKTLEQTHGSLEPVHSHRWDGAGVVLLGSYLESLYRVDRVDEESGSAALTPLRRHLLRPHETQAIPANRFAHQTINRGPTPCITLFVRGTAEKDYNTSFDPRAGSCAPGYAASERDPREFSRVGPLRHALRCMGRLDPDFPTLDAPDASRPVPPSPSDEGP